VIVTRRGDGPSRQPDGEVAAVVVGGTDVGRPEVPPVVDVSVGVGTSVALPVVVGWSVGVGRSCVVSGAGAGVVVSGWLAGAVGPAGTDVPVPAVAAPVVSGRM
jgi:hypothetical protein